MSESSRHCRPPWRRPPRRSRPGRAASRPAASRDDPNAPEAKKIIRTHADRLGRERAPARQPAVCRSALWGRSVRMIRKLARLYEVDFSEQRAKSIIGSLVGVGTAGSTMNLFRLLPGVGALATLATPVASTYALGKVFTEHFESGGTFLTFDPERAKERYQGGAGREAEGRGAAWGSSPEGPSPSRSSSASGPITRDRSGLRPCRDPLQAATTAVGCPGLPTVYSVQGLGRPAEPVRSAFIRSRKRATYGATQTRAHRSHTPC